MELLDRHSLDALLVTNGTNRRYLTGFTAEDHAPDESSGVVLVTASSMTLFTSPTNEPWARAEVNDGVEVVPATRPWTTGVAAECLARGYGKVGFEDGSTSVRDHAGLTRELSPASELVPVGDGVDRLRAIKRPAELAAIQSALRMTDLAFERASARLTVAMTERELAEIVRAELRDAGSDGEAFPTIVASGPNAARPHHVPADRAIGEGEPVIIDMGARANGYCGDLTRTVWLGQPGAQLVTMYRLVADAHAAAVSVVRAGVAARAVDRAARDVFDAAGMGAHVIHSVGHGLGLRVHESPSIGQASLDTLQPGNVITIEPGLYVAGWGGVRIEDVVLVRDDGATNLTGAARHAP
ncbi:MAG: aminopeptidase P family protein [Chloroflexia bacterium]|nr:aminopeptidase P family protein [Chloroflexia bacterium]